MLIRITMTTWSTWSRDRINRPDICIQQLSNHGADETSVQQELYLSKNIFAYVFVVSVILRFLK